MAVLRDYKCSNPDCGREFEFSAALDDFVHCPGEGCGWLALRLPVGTKSYRVQGDNSASVTPKKHRGEMH